MLAMLVSVDGVGEKRCACAKFANDALFSSQFWKTFLQKWCEQRAMFW